MKAMKAMKAMKSMKVMKAMKKTELWKSFESYYVGRLGGEWDLQILQIELPGCHWSNLLCLFTFSEFAKHWSNQCAVAFAL
jgi:hypothetical protein